MGSCSLIYMGPLTKIQFILALEEAFHFIFWILWMTICRYGKHKLIPLWLIDIMSIRHSFRHYSRWYFVGLRYEDNISSGPQSKILEGLTWEEAEKLKEGLIKGGAAPGAHEIIMMGAASKGIIKREQQHNATVYKTYYQVNGMLHIPERSSVRYHHPTSFCPLTV